MEQPVMEERKEPRFVQFTKGEIVAGIFVSMERVTVKDQKTNAEKPVVRYVVREDDGEFVAFFGTHQINQKLRPSDRGHYISVRHEGEDPNVKRGDNHMKVFQVLVSKELAKDGQLYITDEDIPF